MITDPPPPLVDPCPHCFAVHEPGEFGCRCFICNQLLRRHTIVVATVNGLHAALCPRCAENAEAYGETTRPD